ncbi:MAG: SAM hydrolase/SAM-dependent halogenase family protein [Spirochaetota bacterium]
MKQLTFLSDFGLKDSYVAEVKGVLAAAVPEARVIDITHQIEHANLRAASFVLSISFGYFSSSSLHLAVVDPGVGSERDVLIVYTHHYVFIGPDNGLLYQAARNDGIHRIYAVDAQRLYRRLAEAFAGNEVVERIVRQGPSCTFHGRDLFAPAAGYILGGFGPEEIAGEKQDMVMLEIPSPVRSRQKLFGKVIYIDRFGNLITNVPAGMVDPRAEIYLKTGTRVQGAGKLKQTYSQVREGWALALIGSRGYLEIAVNGASAREHFGADYGDDILILTHSEEGV